MELHNLKPAEGAVKNRKRIGRGEGSKRGGTSTRGHKGAKSRSGYSRKIGFEGGQQPLQRRVPKFGFTNPNRKEYNVVNLDTIQNLFDNKKIKNKVSKELLIKNGLVQKKDLVYELIDNHSSRPGHDLRYSLSPKLLKSLGWEPKIKLSKRIEEVVEWSLKNNRWLS